MQMGDGGILGRREWIKGEGRQSSTLEGVW